MLLSLAPPSYSPTQSLRELFNTNTHLAQTFPTTRVASTSPSTSLPSAASAQIRLFHGSYPVGPNQAWHSRQHPGMSAWPSVLPVWLQLEFTGHWLPSQASQQVVGCQQGHDVSGSMGGTANVGQDHWKGEEDGVKRVVQEPYSGPFFQGHGLPVKRIRSCLIFLDLPSLLSLSTPLPRGGGSE